MSLSIGERELNPRQSYPDRAPLPRNLVRVPIVQQAQGFSCGAAATLILLRYWLVDPYSRVDESALYEPLQTTHARGTEPEPMVELLRRSGLAATYRRGDVSLADLERAVDAHEPPIVDLQAWSDHAAAWADTWDAGHYVVMVGYDPERLYFVDPSRATPRGHAFLMRDQLEERWHDLTGEDDRPEVRMAIFARGVERWVAADASDGDATRLG
ncbi:MAG TPA: C39 family peptidase [Polyangiaceae bacterium]|nr:C39 family peptidase [Polyangiaceae bacterium]